MGLDMYLTKKIYVGAEYEHRKVTGKIEINGVRLPVDFKKVSYIEERAGYWRKANAIHRWIVENIQEGVDGCQESYFPTEAMEELLDICNRIIEHCPLVDGKVNNGYSYSNGVELTHIEEGKVMENPEFAEALLPTQSGLFFGGTDYDEYYYQNILTTKEILERCLQDKNGEYYYQASW